MKELIRTNDAVVISFVESLLNDAGIDCLVADQNMSVLDGSIGILPRRVMVRRRGRGCRAAHPRRRRHRQRDPRKLSPPAYGAETARPYARRLPSRRFLAGAAERRRPSRRRRRHDARRRRAFRLFGQARRFRRRRGRGGPCRRVALPQRNGRSGREFRRNGAFRGADARTSAECASSTAAHRCSSPT